MNNKLPRVHCSLNMSHTEYSSGVPLQNHPLFCVDLYCRSLSCSSSDITFESSTLRKTGVDQCLGRRLLPHFRVWVLKFLNNICPSSSPSGMDPMTQNCLVWPKPLSTSIKTSWRLQTLAVPSQFKFWELFFFYFFYNSITTYPSSCFKLMGAVMIKIW